jgi:sugar lactone lactonase YvrE
MVFGGPKLETLYVTSSTMGLSAEELSRQPLAGGLFAIETGIKGRHEHRFAG